jgi:tetratricopeptide (TPR) repeat protein
MYEGSKLMTHLRSSFRNELEEIIQKGVSHLRDSELLDDSNHGPEVGIITQAVQPYLGDQRTPPPSEISTAIAMGIRMGSANEAVGNLPAAMGWYQVGRYYWRGLPTEQVEQNEVLDYGLRMSVGMHQMKAAVCANRAGDSELAVRLFTWAVKNRSLTEEELHEFEETKQPYAVWEWTIERAYALLCLGRFQEALEAGEEALRWIEMDRRAKVESATEMPLLILPTVLALARYQLDPSAENLLEAIERLDLNAVASRIHVDHLLGLFYLFNLRAKYPEFAQPSDKDLPPAARAQQAAEACRAWMRKADIELDGSPESLHRLDHSLPQLYPTIEDEDQWKMVLFMLGSYFGEVVREELAGGQWNFSAETMLSWTVDWDLGDVELHLWPYQRVHEYATGQTDETLFDLWVQTEQAYTEFGLAARYAE